MMEIHAAKCMNFVCNMRGFYLTKHNIKKNIRWRVEFDGSLERKEIPEVPVEAIREALLNSFCHKIYATGQSNEVAIYKDRIEIFNPGQFPEGHTPEDYILHNERPVRRNPKIARTLYLSRQIENFGTGLKRIAAACSKAGVRYEFQQLKTGFVVVFYRSELFEGSVIKDDKVRISTDKVRISMDKLEPQYRKILELVKEKQSITNSDVQILLNIKDSRALKLLKAMNEQGLLQKHGERKGTYYTLSAGENRGTIADDI